MFPVSSTLDDQWRLDIYRSLLEIAVIWAQSCVPALVEAINSLSPEEEMATPAPQPAKKKGNQPLYTDAELSDLVDELYNNHRAGTPGGNFSVSTCAQAAKAVAAKQPGRSVLTGIQCQRQFRKLKSTYSAIYGYTHVKSGVGGTDRDLGSLEFTGSELRTFDTHVSGLQLNSQERTILTKFRGKRWPLFDQMHEMAGPTTATGSFVHRGAITSHPISADDDKDEDDPSHAPLGVPTPTIVTPGPLASSSSFVAPSTATPVAASPDVTSATIARPPSTSSSSKRKRNAEDDMEVGSVAKRSDRSANKPASAFRETALTASVNNMSSSLMGVVTAIDQTRLDSDKAKVAAAAAFVQADKSLDKTQKARLTLFFAKNVSLASTIPNVSDEVRAELYEMILGEIASNPSSLF